MPPPFLIVNAPPPRDPFEWLTENRNRRSALRDIKAAIRRGWLDEATPEHRAALMARLVELMDQADDLPIRQFLGTARVFLAMDRADQEAEWAAVKLMLRLQRRARRPQSPRAKKRG